MIHDIKTENELRKLAGLPLKEAEGGSLDNIIAKHREAFESVMRGDSSLYDHDEFYDELYEHYVSSGEMPYGIAKARDGDPDQWIQEELDREYGDDFATDDGEPMDGDFDSAMASAGMGTDEDYGYYGESKEPKTFREHLIIVQEAYGQFHYKATPDGQYTYKGKTYSSEQSARNAEVENKLARMRKGEDYKDKINPPKTKNEAITVLPQDPNDPMANIYAGGKDAIKKAHKDKKIGYGKGKVDPSLARHAKKRYTDVGVYHDDR